MYIRYIVYGVVHFRYLKKEGPPYGDNDDRRKAGHAQTRFILEKVAYLGLINASHKHFSQLSCFSARHEDHLSRNFT